MDLNYDTISGAGHVRRLNSEKVLEEVLKESLNIMNQCECGGEEMVKYYMILYNYSIY